VNYVAQLSAKPLFLINVDGYGGITAFRTAAAAAAETIGEVRAALHNIDCFAVGANHFLAIGLGHGPELQ
jgi:hypothetical protein